MESMMLVTMGTSLFYSASWEIPNDVLEKEQIEEYKSIWLEGKGDSNKPRALISPERRLEGPKKIKNFFENNLSDDPENIKQWTDYFAKDVKLSTIMRYSAELSTIFELGYRLDRDKGPKEFIKKFKNNLLLIADPNLINSKQNKQWCAANHIKAYLNSYCDVLNAEILNAEGISDTNLKNVIGKSNKTGLNFLLNYLYSKIHDDKINEIFIIASAGFKMYGAFLGLFLRFKKVRLVYRHEHGDNILIIKKDKVIFPDDDDDIDTPGPAITEEGGIESK